MWYTFMVLQCYGVVFIICDCIAPCALCWYANRNVFRVTKCAFFFFFLYILAFARRVIRVWCCICCAFKSLLRLFNWLPESVCRFAPKKKLNQTIHLQYSHTILWKSRINFVHFMDVFAGFFFFSLTNCYLFLESI